MELQKAANQGRRCTWEKLSAIKANCGIELALDECVVMLNHMRRLKRSAERAAAASHGLAATVKFSGSRRIPSWNCLARESSTGSLDEDFLTDVASSLHQGVGGASGKNSRPYRSGHDGSDSESEGKDLTSWTRSGGPLMRTGSANRFSDYVQSLDLQVDLSKIANLNSNVFQMGGETHSQSSRVTTPDRTSENSEFDLRDSSNRSSSSITVTEGDLLHAEKVQEGIVLNVVKRDSLSLPNRSHDTESHNYEVTECLQLDCPEKEIDGSSDSECGHGGEHVETA